VESLHACYQEDVFHLDYPQLAPAAINHSIIVIGMVTG